MKDFKVARIDNFGFVTQVECTNCKETMDVACHNVEWTYERIYDEKKLQPGDHICWYRPFGYLHHAIVTTVEQDIKVINYRYSANMKVECVDLSKVNDHSCSSCFETLYRVNYQDCFDSEYCILRAKKLVDLRGYDLLAQNCEHFTRWCKTGSKYSSQTDMFWLSFRKMAFMIFIRLVGLIILFLIVYAHEIEEEKMANRQQLKGVDLVLTKGTRKYRKYPDSVKLMLMKGNVTDKQQTEMVDLLFTKAENHHQQLKRMELVSMRKGYVTNRQPLESVSLLKGTKKNQTFFMKLNTTQREQLERLERGLEGFYILMLTVVFIIYSVITSGLRLHPVTPTEQQDDIENPGHTGDKCTECVGLCWCCLFCCYSLLHRAMRSCFFWKHIQCSPCTCCRRPCHLACGLFMRICITEMLPAIGVLMILLHEKSITNADCIRGLSPIKKTAILGSICTGVLIVLYTIGLLIGRCVEACCERCRGKE